MIDNLTFLNNQWIWQVGIIGFFLWLVFIWKEWSQYGKLKFFIKTGCALIVLTALAMIALKPQMPISNKANIAVLLTKGYDTNQLDSLKKAHKKLSVYNYKVNQPIFNAAKIPKSVFIIGHGIKPFDLWQLDSINAEYLGGDEPKGISKLKYNDKNTVGNQVKFNGRYNNATQGHKLILEGPGGIALDSAVLTSANNQVFELTAELNIQGEFLFALLEKDTLGKVLSKDPLPLNVIKQNPIKVLIINGIPTFETKYLKNFLAEMGHQVLVRSQLTKDRYKFEYFNMNETPLVGLNQKRLEYFDLVIIDANSLKNSSRREILALENSVKNKGLGLFIQPDNWYYKASVRLSPFNFKSENNSEVRLDEWPRINITKHSFRFEDEFSLQAIHTSNEKIWTAYKRLGEGRIGTSVFQNTYELLLNGHTKAYKYLWSKTIEGLSKKELPINEWSSNGPINFQNEGFNFKLRTAIAEPAITTSEGYQIPMLRHLDIESLWEGTTYPLETGWKKHFVEQDSTEIFQYYVTDTTHWKSLTSYKTIGANKRYFDAHLYPENKQNLSLQTINPLWFYFIFLLSIGYLWLEPKL